MLGECMAAVGLVCVLIKPPSLTGRSWYWGGGVASLDREVGIPVKAPPGICVKMDAIGNTRRERQGADRAMLPTVVL